MGRWQQIDRNDDETIDSEACAHLLHCEATSVEELARAGLLPGVKFGKSWIFIREQVVDAVKRRAIEESEKRAQPIQPQRVHVGSRSKRVPQWLVDLGDDFKGDDK